MFDPSLQSEKVLELTNNVRPRGDFTFKLTRAGKEVIVTGIYQVIDPRGSLSSPSVKTIAPKFSLPCNWNPMRIAPGCEST